MKNKRDNVFAKQNVSKRANRFDKETKYEE